MLIKKKTRKLGRNYYPYFWYEIQSNVERGVQSKTDQIQGDKIEIQPNNAKNSEWKLEHATNVFKYKHSPLAFVINVNLGVERHTPRYEVHPSYD